MIYGQSEAELKKIFLIAIDWERTIPQISVRIQKRIKFDPGIF